MPRPAGPRTCAIIGRLGALALALLLLAGCGDPVPGRVRAADHDRFWLWAGVPPPPSLSRASEVYVLDSEIRGDPARRIDLRPGVPRVAGPDLWLVVRTDRIPWPAVDEAALLAELERWRAAGNRVAGLQVDFDARTRGLADYAAFLTGLRARLPRENRLSITGLMDWSANGDPAALTALAGTVDEVVIQTYQGRDTIPGYEAYFARMRGFPLPFKVGLAEDGHWFAPEGLENEPMFRGYVVFLMPRQR